MIRKKAVLFALPLLVSSTVVAEGPLQVGDPTEINKPRWQWITVDMSAEEYRNAYRDNQKQILNFVEDYSEETLMALGIPKKGVHMMGAVAGAAVTQEATLYLNSSKSLAIDIKDAAEDDRAIYFGFKMDW